MADVTPILIKDLAAQTTLADTDYFIVGGADAKKITVAQMKEALGINALNTNKLSYSFITMTDSDNNYRFAAPTTEKSLTLPSIVGCKALLIKIGRMTTGETSPRAGYVESTLVFSDFSNRHQDTQGFTIYASSSWNCFGGVKVDFSTGQIKFAFQGCTGWDPTQFLIKRVYGLK